MVVGKRLIKFLFCILIFFNFNLRWFDNFCVVGYLFNLLMMFVWKIFRLGWYFVVIVMMMDELILLLYKVLIGVLVISIDWMDLFKSLFSWFMVWEGVNWL